MTFEDRMISLRSRGFARLPSWAQAVLLLWIALGALVFFVPALHSLPYSLRIILLAPVACFVISGLIVAVMVAWGRIVAGPFRWLINLRRKAR